MYWKMSLSSAPESKQMERSTGFRAKSMKRNPHFDLHLTVLIVITKLKVSHWKSNQAIFKGIKIILPSKLTFAKQNAEGREYECAT